MNRRTMLICGLALPLAAAAGTRAKARALEPVKVVIPENSVFVLNWLGAKTSAAERNGILFLRTYHQQQNIASTSPPENTPPDCKVATLKMLLGLAR